MCASALLAVALGALTMPSFVLAQDAPAKTPSLEHYKLVYRMLQVGEDGKVSNSRSYSTIIAAMEHDGVSKIRNGDKVPIATGSSANAINPVYTQYQYQDVGINIDTSRPSVRDRQLSLHVAADSSAVVKVPSDKPLPGPVLRHLNWESDVVVTLDKPTIIFTSENVSDTGKTELELTATPIKEP